MATDRYSQEWRTSQMNDEAQRDIYDVVVRAVAAQREPMGQASHSAISLEAHGGVISLRRSYWSLKLLSTKR